MREVLIDLLTWWEAGATIGMATVVDTWASAPRPVGATMLVGPDGSVVGSVSGGCVEADVYEVARRVMADGVPALQRYGVTGADAYAVGLPCGGTIDVFVEAVSRTTFPELTRVIDAIRRGQPVAVATIVEHDAADQVGRRWVIEPDADPRRGERTSARGLGRDAPDATVLSDARAMLAAGRSGQVSYGARDDRRHEAMRVLVASHAPAPRLLVFGATDVASSVARLAGFVGYRVTVCDARPLFATTARFPTADEVVDDWPHRYLTKQQQLGALDERTAICVLTHDPKFDVPVLEVALRLPAVAYVGAMGSRRAHDERIDKLREAGLTATELARLASPIGLDLGALTPEETAVSVLAEIIGHHRGGGGRPLSELTGRIHHSSDAAAPGYGAGRPVRPDHPSASRATLRSLDRSVEGGRQP